MKQLGWLINVFVNYQYFGFFQDTTNIKTININTY